MNSFNMGIRTMQELQSIMKQALNGRGYRPLNKLKPIHRDIWFVDEGLFRFFGAPFAAPMTIARPTFGEIFCHSPSGLQRMGSPPVIF